MLDPKKLFEPFDGECIKPTPDGKFAVWIPYAHDGPIVVVDRVLAEEIESALRDAHSAGVSAGQAD